MKRILVIGDSCEDVFVYGKVERLCPDAPVPILIPQKTVRTGGMAKNVYDNIKSIYEHVDIITNENIITKTRYVEERTNQMFVRVDSEQTLLSRIKNLNKINLKQYELIVVSDYCKGFLEMDDIQYLCENHSNVFIDTKKVLGDFCLKAKIIKINDAEYKNNTNAHVDMKRFSQNLLVTLGSKGCEFQGKQYPVKRVDIKDMTGAGDTFISALAVNYIQSNNFEEAVEFANKCATVIVQQKGVNKIGDFINKL